MIYLYNVDCLDFLKTLKEKSIDLVLIDPPYEISRKTNFMGGLSSFNISYDFGDWDKNFSETMKMVVQECFRILKPSGTFFCFYDLWKISYLKEWLENAGFKQIRFAEWIKTNPVPINSKINYLSNSREIMITGVKNGNPTFNSEYDNGVYSYPICHEKGRFHPTQKPLPLIEDILRKHSNENDIVVDCFSGSGTTAVACKRLNRNFIGCELNKEFYEKSMERLENQFISNMNENLETYF